MVFARNYDQFYLLGSEVKSRQCHKKDGVIDTCFRNNQGRPCQGMVSWVLAEGVVMPLANQRDSGKNFPERVKSLWDMSSMEFEP